MCRQDSQEYQKGDAAAAVGQWGQQSSVIESGWSAHEDDSHIYI